jgi:branched-chain amino acid transport system permease protein
MALAEIVFWLAAAGCILLFPNRYLILTEIAILALFALSLDLILGYAGIVSLGHAAFFGVGAYAAGLLAKHGIVTEPVLGIGRGGLAAMAARLRHQLPVLRGSDLTRLMVTLGVALILRELANRLRLDHRRRRRPAGHRDGPILGLFDFDIFGNGLSSTASACCSCCSCWRGASCIRPSACRCARSATIRCAPRRSAFRQSPADRDLHARRAYAGVAGALLDPDDAARLARRARPSIARPMLMLVLIIGGTGYLYGGLIGAVASSCCRTRSRR